jgi:erythronate-4-phosphate dehydrogenase
MKILADENIPYVKEVFSHLGEVVTMPGRSISREKAADADLLLVRSITRVDGALLAGGRVKFVATATIGFDHVDVKYLASQGIRFASAPGSNATSVAEYMVSALFHLSRKHGFRLRDRSIGIVGAGNVGSRVAARCRALGMSVKLSDPPLADATGKPEYRPLEELLDSDILTFHVPLEKSGPYPTYKMISEPLLLKTKKGVILFNTSRGDVGDEKVIRAFMDKGHFQAVALDVWENEPRIDADLLGRVDIGTPHIAGYSFDGKVKGTEMIYRAAVEFLGRESSWRLTLPDPPVPEVAFTGPVRDAEDCLAAAVTAVYDAANDSLALKRMIGMDRDAQGPWFDRLRREYPVRREFANTRIALGKPAPRLKAALKALEFVV